MGKALTGQGCQWRRLEVECELVETHRTRSITLVELWRPKMRITLSTCHGFSRPRVPENALARYLTVKHNTFTQNSTT